MSTKSTTDIATLPTEFRGCVWNDGWEFDAPCVIYSPKKYAAFKSAGNTGGIDQLVEDICMNLALGWDHNDGGLSGECAWRGWGKRFDRRRSARHVILKVRWSTDTEGQPVWREISRKETYGLPLAARSANKPDGHP